MAAPKENLLSLGHLTSMERNTFTKQREHGLKKSVNRPMLLQADSTRQSHQHLRALHLQQRWQELKEREFAAQQHNRQLLHQFEEAQDTLREMLTLNAAMKTIRREYERYLEESAPRWQQQLKEKTQAAQSKRMEEYLNSCLKNTERVTKSQTDQPFLSQSPATKPQKMDAPQKHYSQNSHLDYNQEGSPHLPYTQPSWQTQPQSQTARFPIRAPNQPQGSSHVRPSVLPPPICPHPFQLHHLAYMPGQHHPRQNPPGWASQQPNYPWSWIAGAAGIPSGSEALWDRLYTEEAPPERRFAHVVGEEAETSKASSSKRERGGGSRSSHLSQELDVKPVRLSSGPAESSESSRESSQASRERRKKREKRGRSQRTSSEKETCSSQESSRTSSAIITAAVTAARSSESDTSSEKGRTSTRRRRSEGLSVGSPRAEKVTKERIRSKADDSGSHKDESQPTSEELVSPVDESRSEKVGDRSPEDKSESCTEESGSQREEESGSFSTKIENGDEKQESHSSEESSVEEKGEKEEHEKDLGDGEEGDGEEKEDSQRDEEERDAEDDEASERKNTAEEEEATGAEEEMEEQESEEKSDQEEHSDRMKNEDGVNGKQDSSQDEESEGGEEKLEEDGESDEEEEEEQRRDEVEEEEERDSEDSIISPQNKSKMIHIIPEEASEEEEEEEVEGSKTGSSDSNEFSDEDIERQLAPQEQSQQKEEKDLKADEKPKAVCDMVEIFQVEMDRPTKTNNPSDSEEFDHFYD